MCQQADKQEIGVLKKKIESAIIDIKCLNDPISSWINKDPRKDYHHVVYIIIGHDDVPISYLLLISFDR